MAVFRRRRFATVVIGEGVSMVGDAASEIALAWTVLRSTGPVAALAGVLLFQAVPRGVLTPTFQRRPRAARHGR